MASTLASASTPTSAWQRIRRWLGRWWVHQPAARQDRFVTLAPTGARQVAGFGSARSVGTDELALLLQAD